MRVVCFYHSLISDWNHGNAHFLRGVVSELLERGHEVRVYEPRSAWSAVNLVADEGPQAIAAFHAAYPGLTSERYGDELDLDAVLDGADAVLVHEWSDPALVARIGVHHATHHYALLFHDTHHRSVTAPRELAAYDLTNYDGVLAFGRVIRDLYLERGWVERAWTWHEAADVRRFVPQRSIEHDGDVVWIGNWGDGERSQELREMLIEPVARMRIPARVHGVRYPMHALRALEAAGIVYGGWLPNFRVPAVFAHFRATLHIPRRPYVEALPGIPTIRMFEALACGIPLICSPWSDTEQLFAAGEDYLVAKDGEQMQHMLELVLHDRTFAKQLAAHGLATIQARHTCAHRVDELLGILAELGAPVAHREAS